MQSRFLLGFEPLFLFHLALVVAHATILRLLVDLVNQREQVWIVPLQILARIRAELRDKSLNEEPAKVQRGGTPPDLQTTQCVATPVAYFLWLPGEEFGWLQPSEKVTEPFDVLR